MLSGESSQKTVFLLGLIDLTGEHGTSKQELEGRCLVLDEFFATIEEGK